ncbi:hypothetical protein [Pseudomonas sp. efr-133-TYG-23]|uniref:hypothetical protein n=1 Tax=Pseudomonas sp. efr-133-TYG-23 TaxID=3040309 RepID=UPI00255687EC|nr:hypothetical protein [Pseudomonas sp. efr-133-TYG-23]
MWLKPVALALLLAPLVTACFSEPFQPPAADADLWEKPGASSKDVLASMLACGEKNGSGIDPNASFQERAQRFVCMKARATPGVMVLTSVHCAPKNR